MLATSATGAGAVNLPTGFQDTKLAFTGLVKPTNLKFAPDGRVFVALQSGKILVFSNVEDSTATEFADLRKPVHGNGDRGILGLALDPNFASNHFVYVLYTYDHILGKTPADGIEGRYPRWGEASSEYEGDPCPESSGCVVSGRLVRLTAEGDHASPSAAAPAETVLTEDWCQQFSSHSIGDLQFGPEGARFASGGEGASFDQPDYGQFGNPCGDPPHEGGS